MPDTEKPKARGWRRTKEISVTSEADRKALEGSLIQGLGREASALDLIAAENPSRDRGPGAPAARAGQERCH